MTRFLLRLSLCTAALAAVTTTVAHAADFEPPPPEASWTGPYIGGFVMPDLQLQQFLLRQDHVGS